MAEGQDAPPGGALSIDDAVAWLDRRDAVDVPEAPSAPDRDDEIEGAAGVLEDADGGAEDPDDGLDETDADAEGEVDRLAPPTYWSKEAKARFAELDPELQAVVLAQEGPREAATAKAKAEAKAVRDEALRHVAEADSLLETLAEALPEAIERWQARWQGTPDWAALAETHGIEAATEARAQFAAEQGQLMRAQAAADAAEQARQRLYVARETEALRRLDPELVDPVRGDQLRSEVAGYLRGQGVDADQLSRISAVEMSLARKAMLWDRAQARARATATSPRPSAPSTRPLARGGASAGPVDPKARRAAQAKTRFAKSRSVEDAVALLNAQGD